MSEEVKQLSVGVKNVLEVVNFAIALEKAISQAKADGKIGIEDAALLFPVVPLLAPAIDEIDQIPAELKDLDEAELEQLVAEVSKIFGGESKPAVILKIKACLKFAHSAYGLFLAFKK